MPDPGPLRFRRALRADAAAIAALHADSWQRHYRGAFSDAFLDGEVEADRAAVWSERFDADPAWGALLDNLHVVHDRQRGGVGARLLRLSAETVVNHSPGSGLPPPAGDPGRLHGSPMRLRYAWPEPGELGQS